VSLLSWEYFPAGHCLHLHSGKFKNVPPSEHRVLQALVGAKVGALVGISVGAFVGVLLGCFVGDLLGGASFFVGLFVGDVVGAAEGLEVGDWDGELVGAAVGELVGPDLQSWLSFIPPSTVKNPSGQDLQAVDFLESW